VSQHRAPRRRAEPSRAEAPAPSEVTPGRHRCGRTHQPETVTRRGLGFLRPSGAVVVGTSAVVVAAAGALSVGSAQALHGPQQHDVRTLAISSPVLNRDDLGARTADDAPPASQEPRGSVAPSDSLGWNLDRNGRPATISRSAGRKAVAERRQDRLEAAAERQAAARNDALAELASRAEKHAKEIAADLWVLPVEGYDLTATFGSGGSLWSADHTGLDFAAPYGAPVVSVAGGTVTDVGYAGAYGNRVIVTHADGTETWYCHLADYGVSRGQQVGPGTTVGSIGMTGNTTGPHLHFEVRPDPRVPVDPFTALTSHGVRP
jgi:murein DD-endopeptidase MepM/ murein hydrolase activator NlpD